MFFNNILYLIMVDEGWESKKKNYLLTLRKEFKVLYIKKSF